MNRYFFQIFLLTIFCILGCSENSTKPEFENDYVRRDYRYDKNILLNAGVDTNDFKKEYTIEEINNIIFTSNENIISNHRSVRVDDDIGYANIYALALFSYDVLEGIVKSTGPEWDENHRFIETVTLLDVTRSYKGEVMLDEIIMRHVGGILDGYRTDVFYSPLPEFQIDERVLVFIQESENGEYRTYGRQQGKFKVVILEEN